MKKIAHIVVALAMAIPSVAEFRTWTDRNGNSMEAEFVRKSGKEIILRDTKGKSHWVDPEKLSDEDRLFLNPPPPEPQEYELSLHRSSQQKILAEDEDTITAALTYECTMKVDFLTEDASQEGLRGALFFVGSNPDGVYVVISKTEAPVEMVGAREGRVQAESFELSHTTDDDKEWIGGTKYREYLLVLYAQDGTVLETRATKRFLEKNIVKTFSLNVGDRFNEQCEMVSGE